MENTQEHEALSTQAEEAHQAQDEEPTLLDIFEDEEDYLDFEDIEDDDQLHSDMDKDKNDV